MTLTTAAPDDPDTPSFVIDTFASYQDLNLTADYIAFVDQIRGRVGRSLATILMNKEEIAKSIVNHLAKQDSLAFEPLLE